MNKRKQKSIYSGKKRAHTVKTQLTVSKRGRILDVSKSYAGCIHDKTVIEKGETIARLPKKTRKRVDKGYDAP